MAQYKSNDWLWQRHLPKGVTSDGDRLKALGKPSNPISETLKLHTMKLENIINKFTPKLTIQSLLLMWRCDYIRWWLKMSSCASCDIVKKSMCARCLLFQHMPYNQKQVGFAINHELEKRSGIKFRESGEKRRMSSLNTTHATTLVLTFWLISYATNERRNHLCLCFAENCWRQSSMICAWCVHLTRYPITHDFWPSCSVFYHKLFCLYTTSLTRITFLYWANSSRQKAEYVTMSLVKGGSPFNLPFSSPVFAGMLILLLFLNKNASIIDMTYIGSEFIASQSRIL